ncbi:MAG: VPS10 domain-containing protein [Gemmatimonadota bacterium]
MRRFLLLAAVAAAAVPAAPLGSQTPFDNLRFRSIGPAALGGRISDVEGVPGDPLTLYVAAASGGIWKSTNKGTTWTPIFDDQAVSTFGDIAIFEGNADILYVGTGEQNNRQSTSWGNGVYKSTDGGKTWSHLGLGQTRHTGRIVIHPSNPDIVYVASPGNLWAAGPDRGVYKTTDGGRTWNKVLYVDTLTGATDIVINRSDPNTLVAATYQRLRTPWGFNGGGPGSAIHKSTDGGVSWRRITAGIPSGDKGRIGLAIARSNPRVLVATIEHQTEGGTYRSEDGGESWTRVNRLNPRPMYYSKPAIDPTNPDVIWIPGVSVYRSVDGGRNFRTLPTGPTYDVGLKGDHHSFWINPREPRHAYLGGDGGLHETWDAGETWVRMNNIPIGQFYAIDADNRDPYWVYGGMQDNHSWMGPSQTRHWLGIVNEDWRQIGFGDGMYQRADPFNPRRIYTASQNLGMQRFDVETGDRQGLRPLPPAGDSAYRFDWMAPIVPSRHTPGTVYAGGNRLFTTRDYGNSWTRSRDLTRQVNRDTLPIMGVLGSNITLSRYDGESAFSELTTLSESPLDPMILWIGTDDGLVHVSRDAGATFTEVGVNVPGVPARTLVTRVAASRAGRGVAWVAFDGHRSGDLRPWLFRTTDYGRTWTRMTSGLPADMPVRTVTEHPGNVGVVFAGMEFALYYSTDTARTWTRMTSGLPTTRYDDIVVHQRTGDIIAGTHGRSIWILDDATPIVDWSPALAARRSHLFPVRTATLFQFWQDFSYRAHAAYAGDNPMDGALISYHLNAPAAKVQLLISGPDGRVIRTLDGPATPGQVHRVNWDLRHRAPPGGGGFGGGGGGGGEGGEGGPQASLPILPRPIGERGPFVAPGSFAVTLDVDGQRSSQRFVVRADPLLPVTVAQHQQRETFLVNVLTAQDSIASMGTRMTQLRPAITALRERSGEGSAARSSADTAANRLTALERTLRAGPGAVRGRAYGLAGEYNGTGALQGTLYPPTRTHRDAFAAILADLRRISIELAELEARIRTVQ